MFGRNACLLSVLLMMASGTVFSQPPGYSEDDAGTAPSSADNVRIAIAWGEQLRPPSRYPQVIINLKEAMMKWTKTPVTITSQFRIGSPDLMKQSIVFVSTDKQFQLTDTEKKNLRGYIAKGGLLVVDNATAEMSNSQAGASLLQMVKDIAGSKRLESVPNTHPIYETPFKLGGPPLGSDIALTKVGEKIGADGAVQDSKVLTSEAGALQGVFINGRLAILFSNKGYTAKWNDFTNDVQLKFGVNLITYALSQKR